MKYTPAEMFAKLPFSANEKWKNGVWDMECFRQGNVSMIFFTPKIKDYQTFHEEDELYFIVSGKGELIIDKERFSCESGDAFFVPKLVEHHFENFTEDFATWAVFF